jgi:hypothetical protein
LAWLGLVGSGWLGLHEFTLDKIILVYIRIYGLDSMGLFLVRLNELGFWLWLFDTKKISY